MLLRTASKISSDESIRLYIHDAASREFFAQTERDFLSEAHGSNRRKSRCNPLCVLYWMQDCLQVSRESSGIPIVCR